MKNKKTEKPKARRVRVPATKTDFQALSTILVGERPNRVQDLERSLLSLQDSFNNRQALLFKTLALLYIKDPQLQAKTFQEFVDKVESDFDNIVIEETNSEMIAMGIKHVV